MYYVSEYLIENACISCILTRKLNGDKQSGYYSRQDRDRLYKKMNVGLTFPVTFPKEFIY